MEETIKRRVAELFGFVFDLGGDEFRRNVLNAKRPEIQH
jgi:hypothetical protein